MARRELRTLVTLSDELSRDAVMSKLEPSDEYAHGTQPWVWNESCRRPPAERPSGASESSNGISAPALLERNATFFPSGDRTGDLSVPIPSPSGIAAPPEVDARQTRPHHANTKNEPSGETDGDSARYISDQSRTAGDCSCAGICATDTAATEIAERRIAVVFIIAVSGRMRRALLRKPSLRACV